MASTPSHIDLKRRVSTRLAWLEISQKDFAKAIGMNQSVFSRAIRARTPRTHTVTNIAIGLGLTPDQLRDSDDKHVLLCDHPGLSLDVQFEHRLERLEEWYKKQEVAPNNQKTAPHRSDEERHLRRMAVRKAIKDGAFTIRTVKILAHQFEVSTSQIHSDRSMIVRIEPELIKKP